MATKATKLFNGPTKTDSDKEDIYVYKQWRYKPIPLPKLRYIPPAYVDFQQYITEHCHNKVHILDRATFHQIKRPIFIMFNHFRKKCSYHTKWLDRMYELALKYGDRIEFIAADMIDMDIMYPRKNPLSFFSTYVRPGEVNPYIYAIDDKKCVHELLDYYKELESLRELCEHLLDGTLFLSQPIPDNENNLVKMCVHGNHEELVSKSSKNILLIISLSKFQDNEINYDGVALAFKDYNLGVVYMQAEHNYIPFEYCACGFPTIIFIPHNDKKNFVYYKDMITKDKITEFLKNIFEKPEYLPLLQQQENGSMQFTGQAQVPRDFLVDYNNGLSQFLLENYGNSIEILDRQMLHQSKYLIIIAFMDFKQGQCLAHHVEWFNKLSSVASTLYEFLFFVADFKDIDVINTNWQPVDLIKTAQGKPKIYGFDRLNHSFEFDNFNSISSLFYFADSLEHGDFYYSQDYSRNIEKDVVKDWPANYFNFFLNSLQKHIFITFYSTDDANAAQLVSLLNDIAQDVNDWNVEVVKFNVKLNYVDLEYAQDSYPVHYFINKHNKRAKILYNNNDFSGDNVREFIRINVENKT